MGCMIDTEIWHKGPRFASQSLCLISSVDWDSWTRTANIKGDSDLLCPFTTYGIINPINSVCSRWSFWAIWIADDQKWSLPLTMHTSLRLWPIDLITKPIVLYCTVPFNWMKYHIYIGGGDDDRPFNDTETQLHSISCFLINALSPLLMTSLHCAELLLVVTMLQDRPFTRHLSISSLLAFLITAVSL